MAMSFVPDMPTATDVDSNGSPVGFPSVSIATTEHVRIEPATISASSDWHTISELAASIELALDGRYNIAVESDANLELVALSQSGNQVHVTPLGNEGVVDTTNNDYTALMVFNRALPDTPGDCSGAGYSLAISSSRAGVASPAYSFSAEHFTPLVGIEGN